MSNIEVYQSAIKKGRVCAGCSNYETYIRIENKGLEVIKSGSGERVLSWIIGVDLT